MDKTGNSKGFQTNEIIINNAGLVILHPFLKLLFEQLDLWKNDEWKEHNSQQKAVLLTQYLVTGQDEIQEYELTLNKILCGLPIESVVDTEMNISSQEKKECQKVLQSVISHWEALNNTSIDGLRDTFLKRTGKLVINNHNSFELIIENKSLDILLNNLPWGIGMIKTPWMENYLNNKLS